MLTSCGNKRYTISSISGRYIPVVETMISDTGMVNFVGKYKAEVDRRMNQSIGYSDLYMEVGHPESLLVNFTSDAMMQLSSVYSQVGKIDFSVMNIYGHRASMPKGEITIGSIYKIYPFDNALVTIQLKGKYVTEMFESYAKVNRTGVSSNVRIKIKGGKLTEALIDGKPVDNNKMYTIVTLDYLAEGNDGVSAMKNASSIDETNNIYIPINIA